MTTAFRLFPRPETQALEFKTVTLETNEDSGVFEDFGVFEGYGAIFGNRDRDGDILEKGAFADSLKRRQPALLWQHNTKEPIGRFEQIYEDGTGLWVKGRLSREGRGGEAYDLLKMRALDGLSIGFMAREASRDARSGTRTIHRADLMEISLVTFPANEQARITHVKSTGTPATPRDFEKFLRISGFSRRRAKAITAHGFNNTDFNSANLGNILGTKADAAALATLLQQIETSKARLQR